MTTTDTGPTSTPRARMEAARAALCALRGGATAGRAPASGLASEADSERGATGAALAWRTRRVSADPASLNATTKHRPEPAESSAQPNTVPGAGVVGSLRLRGAVQPLLHISSGAGEVEGIGRAVQSIASAAPKHGRAKFRAVCHG